MHHLLPGAAVPARAPVALPADAPAVCLPEARGRRLSKKARNAQRCAPRCAPRAARHLVASRLNPTTCAAHVSYIA
jgi:hypothetical protein